MEGDFHIGEWLVQPTKDAIIRGDSRTRVTPKAMDVLVQLAKHSDEVLSKECIIPTVWPDTFVGDDVLTQAISELRKAFQDDAKCPRVIETVPKRGYQLIAPVSWDATVQPFEGKRRRSSGRRVHWYVGSAMGILIGIALAAYFVGKTTKPEHPVRVHRQLTFEGNAYLPSLSPHGDLLAYSEGLRKGYFAKRLLIRDPKGGEPLEVYGESLGPATWSPDGSRFLFLSWKLSKWNLPRWYPYILPKLGGQKRLLTELPLGTICWSPDGAQVAGVAFGAKGFRIKVLGVTTGEVEQTIALELESDAWPFSVDWSPNGKFFAVQAGTDIWTVAADDKFQHKVFSVGQKTPVRWSPRGDAIYFLRHEMELHKIRVSPETGEGLSSQSTPILTGQRWLRHFTFARDTGDLVYARSHLENDLWCGDTTAGRPEEVLMARRLTQDSREYRDLAVSPDGKEVAFVRHTPGEGDNIFTIPIAGGEARQFTYFERRDVRHPVWSVEGRSIAFASRGDRSSEPETPGPWRVSLAETIGDKRPIEFGNSKLSPQSPLVWLPNDRLLFWSRWEPMVLDISTGKEKSLHAFQGELPIKMPRGQRHRASPDGRTIASSGQLVVKKNTLAIYGIWLSSAEDTQPRLVKEWPHSRDMGTYHPPDFLRWSRDGKWLYVIEYEGEVTNLVKIEVDSSETQTICQLPSDRLYAFDISPDGNHFIYADYREESNLWMVENFEAALGRR